MLTTLDESQGSLQWQRKVLANTSMEMLAGLVGTHGPSQQTRDVADPPSSDDKRSGWKDARQQYVVPKGFKDPILVPNIIRKTDG